MEVLFISIFLLLSSRSGWFNMFCALSHSCIEIVIGAKLNLRHAHLLLPLIGAFFHLFSKNLLRTIPCSKDFEFSYIQSSGSHAVFNVDNK